MASRLLYDQFYNCCTHQPQSVSDTEVLSFVSLAGPSATKLSPFVVWACHHFHFRRVNGHERHFFWPLPGFHFHPSIDSSRLNPTEVGELNIQVWPWLSVIKLVINGIIHSINGVLLVLIIGIAGQNCRKESNLSLIASTADCLRSPRKCGLNRMLGLYFQIFSKLLMA